MTDADHIARAYDLATLTEWTLIAERWRKLAIFYRYPPIWVGARP